jgi:hypothetical protein
VELGRGVVVGAPALVEDDVGVAGEGEVREGVDLAPAGSVEQMELPVGQ